MDEYKKFYIQAARFLDYCPRSEKEVRDKLASQKAPIDIVDKVIAKLKSQRFLDDLEFARMWVESRTNFKPKSSWIVKLELKNKGISQEVIDLVMHSSESVVQSDLEKVEVLVEKKIDKYKHLPKHEIYQKLGGFLARKGFSWDTIKTSIDEALKERV